MFDAMLNTIIIIIISIIILIMIIINSNSNNIRINTIIIISFDRSGKFCDEIMRVVPWGPTGHNFITKFPGETPNPLKSDIVSKNM